MERLNAGSAFDGLAQRGARYVLVDDVTTMGGTLADFADHIVAGGGEVIGAVVLVSDARSGLPVPDQRVVHQLERRFGDAIRELFNIKPAALTAGEAGSLIGFRDADEIRNRSTKAKQETADRFRTRGLRTISGYEIGSVSNRHGCAGDGQRQSNPGVVHPNTFTSRCKVTDISRCKVSHVAPVPDAASHGHTNPP
jgi:hypothetical protein